MPSLPAGNWQPSVSRDMPSRMKAAVKAEDHRIAVYGRFIDATLFRSDIASDKHPVPGILLLHEAFGVTSQIKEDAKELAGLGYGVLVPDLYSETGAARYCIRQFITEAGMKNRSSNPAVHELFHVLDYLETLPCIDRERIGAVGMCLTGGFILHLARRPELKAPVIFHHSLGLAGAGVSPRAAAQVRHTIQGHYVTNDLFCPKARQEALRDLLGDKLDYHLYPGAKHGLRSVDRNTRAGQEAWEKTKAFFAEHLAG